MTTPTLATPLSSTAWIGSHEISATSSTSCSR